MVVLVVLVQCSVWTEAYRTNNLKLTGPHSPALSKVLGAARERSRMLSFTPASRGTAADMQPLLCILCGTKTESRKAGNCLHFIWLTVFVFVFFKSENGPSVVASTEESAMTLSLHFPLPALSTGTKATTSTEPVWFFLQGTSSFWHSLFKDTILTPAQHSCAFFVIKTDSDVQFNQFYTRIHWLIYLSSGLTTCLFQLYSPNFDLFLSKSMIFKIKYSSFLNFILWFLTLLLRCLIKERPCFRCILRILTFLPSNCSF